MTYAEYYTNYTVQFPGKEIWFPPVVLMNTVDTKKKIEILETTMVNIDQNGTVSVMIYVQLFSDCDLDFKMYYTFIYFTKPFFPI